MELGLTKDMFLTLQDYAKANHTPAPSGTRHSELSLGKNTCGEPVRRRRAAGRRVVLRHGAGREPARGRRRRLQQRGPGAALAKAPGNRGGLVRRVVAGMVAAAQQGQAVPFGFLNPVLYKLYRTSTYYGTQPLTSSPAHYRGTYCPSGTCGGKVLTTFDDQSPDMAGYTGQVAPPGYDNMTGLGTPNGPAFIQHLRELAR